MPSPTPTLVSARPSLSGGASRNSPASSSVSTRSFAQSRYAAPGTWPVEWTCRPDPSGRQRTSTTRTSGRPRLSASHSVDASSSGRA